LASVFWLRRERNARNCREFDTLTIIFISVATGIGANYAFEATTLRHRSGADLTLRRTNCQCLGLVVPAKLLKFSSTIDGHMKTGH
jgi:hypothetical protein